MTARAVDRAALASFSSWSLNSVAIATSWARRRQQADQDSDYRIHNEAAGHLIKLVVRQFM